MNPDILKKDYPALSVISSLLSIIGVLIIIISIGGVIFGITLLDGYSTKQAGIIFIIASILCGLPFSLIFIGSSELIKLMVRIEYNTRAKDQKLIRVESNENPNRTISSDKSNSEYEEWKKLNPGKSINDFYAKKQR